jgi:hypothetical protein
MHVYMGSADFDRNRLNADTGSNNSSEKHGNRKARQCVRRERGFPSGHKTVLNFPCRIGVKGCRGGYVGSTSGVPHIAADLSRRARSAALGQMRTSTPSRSRNLGNGTPVVDSARLVVPMLEHFIAIRPRILLGGRKTNFVDTVG